MREVREHIKTLRQKIAEGKTSEKEQMDAIISRAVRKRMEKEALDKASEDASVVSPI